MTEQQVRDTIALWQQRLGLNHWAIVVKIDTPQLDGKTCLATVERSTFYDNATITVHPAVIGESTLPTGVDTDAINGDAEHYYEGALVHELLHVLLRDVLEAGDLIRDQLSRPAIDVWDGAWRRAEEATVDRLAAALVANWP